MSGLKLVVFDLDETLGHFSQLSCFMNAVSNTSRIRLNIDQCISIYPEVIRPGIVKCLMDLADRMKLGENIKVILYTNNNGGPSWAGGIIRCLNRIVKYPVFSLMIPGYVGPGSCRTTMEKTAADLYRCVGCPRDTKICFVDDSNHPGMVHPNVYYIHLHPYYAPLKVDTMVARLHRRSTTRVPQYILHDNIAQDLNKQQIAWYYQDKRSTEERLNELLLYNHLQIFLDS